MARHMGGGGQEERPDRLPREFTGLVHSDRQEPPQSRAMPELGAFQSRAMMSGEGAQV